MLSRQRSPVPAPWSTSCADVLQPHYAIDLREPERHRIQITLTVTASRDELQLSLPCWTPGSYLERDYVRHLEGLWARCGERLLQPQRCDRHSWRITGISRGESIEVHYTVLGVESSVRTNWLDGQSGFLTAAAWALGVEGCRWQPHQLSVQLPEGWQVATALSRVDGGWCASDYDQLIDAPLALGHLAQLDFSVGGVPHHWVWQGLLQPAPVAAWQEHLPRLCSAVCALLGTDRPASDDYLFMTRFTAEGYGGLEHDDCTALMFCRRQLATAAGSRKLLQLAAHEYLHQWNVRRLRPAQLRPYRYDGAVLIPELWFAEGVTSYYDQLVLLHAGLCSESDYLSDLAKDISRLLTTPGRSVQSLLESGTEAWVKLYRRDAHSDNQQVSYYLKGAMVALLIDLYLLAKGSGLHVLLQQLWQRFGSCTRGYTQQDLMASITALDADLGALVQEWLSGVDDLPLAGYLKNAGLLLSSEPCSVPFSGLHLDLVQGQLQVRRVESNSPGEDAGLSPGDELLALDGERLRRSEQFDQWLVAGLDQQLLICRDGAVRSMVLSSHPPQPKSWSLRLDPEANEEACRLRHRWFTGPTL